VHPGQHAAIVDEDLWRSVQDRLARNDRAAKTRTRAKSPSALAGRLVGPDGQKMRPSHATKNGRRYRYYISAGLAEGSIATGARGWRIPAAEIEAVIAGTIAAKVRDPAFLSEQLRTVDAQADPAQPAHLRLAGRNPGMTAGAERRHRSGTSTSRLPTWLAWLTTPASGSRTSAVGPSERQSLGTIGQGMRGDRKPRIGSCTSAKFCLFWSSAGGEQGGRQRWPTHDRSLIIGERVMSSRAFSMP
jgi:hypothetical protein